jgi:PAS domain S-box-containing protein
MKDQSKTKQVLIQELALLRQRIEELERSESGLKKEKEELKKIEIRFRNYFNLPMHGIAVISPKKGWIEVNDRICFIMGYSRDEITRLAWSEMTHPDDLAANLEQFNRVLSGQIDHYNMDKRFICKDGTVVWTNLTVGSVRKPDGSVDHIIAIVEDITERRKMEEIRNQLAAIVESADDSIIGKDLEGIIVSWNNGAEVEYGYNKNEVIGKSISLLMPPGRPDEYKEILAKITHGEKIKNYETQRRRKDGQIIDVLLTISPVKDISGKIIGASTIARDITERKRVKKALSENEAIFTAVFHASPNLISITKIADGKILDINDGYSKLLGYSRDESIGKTTKELSIWANPADRITFAGRLEKIGEITDFETTLRRKDGTVVTVLDSARTIELQGEMCLLSVAHNITERKQYEESLHNVSLYTRSLIEASLDPLVTINPEGKITDVNKATEIITGISRGQLVGSDFTEYFTEPEKARAGYQQVLYEGLVRDYPLTIRHTSGSTIDVLFNATVYKNEAGQVQGVFAAARDITERKKADEELRVRTKDLEEANIALKVLLNQLEKGRNDLEERILSNIREIILPYINNLRHGTLSVHQVSLINTIESNLNRISSSFLQHLKLNFYNLTPREIEIANLVKEGRSIKEIAELLNVTKKTIEFHRSSLRNKLGIKNKKANLRSHLLNI